MAVTLKEHILVDGVTSEVSLTHSGVLSWTGGKSGSLVVQDELLGCSRGDRTITLHAFQFTSSGCTTSGCGESQRMRKDLVFTFHDQDAQLLWLQAIQRCLDNSGSYT